MSSIKDRMVYLVVSAHKSGDFLPERNVCDLDRATTIKDIADGQFDTVAQVLELNPVEGVCRDVTQELLAAAEALDSKDGLVRNHPQYAAWDHAHDLRKHEVA